MVMHNCKLIFTASGSGEIQDEEISNGLRYISMFLRELYQGRNLQPSFPPLPLLAHRSQEQIEEEGGNEELESQMINKGSNNWRQSIMDITNMAKAAILNYFVDQSNLEPF
ncbi:MAG: hypothetical protein EZS28_009866 [Streblomastix strix]|uniref:Uncharacterized protein n=1 Tax=Streblomastix strix TaxID=222440 RepID=A0A5J4WIQ1_9EUKA|nr:MAG: hypothetical protein EZS28_009866 [Streblomastix strix]